MSGHLFVTQDYAPDLGGMARRHVELCRRIPGVTVSTVSAPGASAFDAGESYRIVRERCSFKEAKKYSSQIRWSASLVRAVDAGARVIHLGNIRPCGYALQIARRRRAVPYVVYVNGGDLLREEQKLARQAIKRWSARDILGHARGIVANSPWTAGLVERVMARVGVKSPPPVAAIDLGTDPSHFHPARDRGALRARLGIGNAPLLVTVARLVPHKGQDVVIDALAALGGSAREAHYLVVGEGVDRERLIARARDAGIGERVHLVGALSDDDVAEAYATATVYVGMSRVDQGINVEGFGISFVEASASGVPVIGGDSGGVRAAIRDGETGWVLPPTDVALLAERLGHLLADPSQCREMGTAGRRAVERHYHWDRVATETLAFVDRVTGMGDR